jgi:ribosomal protein S18 acetylase RimI-like enzyme
MEIRHIESGDEARLVRFLGRVPAADRTFFKEDVDDPQAAHDWMQAGPARTIAVDGGEVVGWLAIVPKPGWSRHVGEVRLIVDPQHRGRGIGRTLARRAVLEALDLGLEKMVVEVIAVQEATIAMFRSLGFDPEALLTDHVRDRNGDLRDLMVLSHSVQEQWSSMIMAGIADDV